ncbi:hypothetical protein EG329_009487 [Mollisiaceae sp. DMI_Dod_QoI]|nr:hypothetical protein EG329_009487 [Helotiales sp. DMI_Dod_QoI]
MVSVTPSPKPTGTERIKMMSSPRVTISVGPKKKCYSLPKDLLCYHSPYFGNYFNCKGVKAQKLELLDDHVEDFDALVDYILNRTIPAQKHANTKRNIEGNKATITQCLRFLVYANRYELGDVSEVIYEPLHKALYDLAHHKRRIDAGDLSIDTNKSGQRCGVDGDDLEIVFRTCPAESRLRALMAQAALSFSGPRGLKEWAEQIENVPGFAGELMEQLASSFVRQSWVDPLTKQRKNY